MFYLVYFEEKYTFFCIFLSKYLVSSKKSSTFASAFEKNSDL